MIQTVIPTNTALVALDALEQERKALLSTYHPHDHLAKWVAFDKRSGSNVEVIYYPAAWRLYELSLRYTNANFSSDIIHMDAEKDFVIVRARLYLGADYASSVKKAEAYKQGKLTELDKVETKAKARAARDFGIGTEHALDMDDLEAASVPSGDMTIKEEKSNGQRVVESAATPKQLPAPNASKSQQNGQEGLQNKLDALYESANAKGYVDGLKGWEMAKAEAFGAVTPDESITEPQYINLRQYIVAKARQASAGK